MIAILFKNVGQGDSILLEWARDGKQHYGVIDCNLYEKTNPLLEEVVNRKIAHFEFVILSHLHHDHYSGLSDFFEYCYSNGVGIDIFLHTFTTDYLHILSLTVKTQAIQNNTVKLLQSFEKLMKHGIIKETDSVSHNFTPIELFGNAKLSFLAPNGADSLELARQRNRYENNITTKVPDFNIMSTIIKIGTDNDAVLLTADGVVNSFNRIVGKVESKIHLVQVPHHGSINNLHEVFFKSIPRIEACNAIYSVGDAKRDRLPNKSVVDFFESEGYNNTSTNLVYGLLEKYGTIRTTQTSSSKTLYLKTFGTKRSAPRTSQIPDRFNGDKSFNYTF